MLRVTKFLVAFLCCALCTDRSFSATEVDSVLRISEPEDFYPLNLKAYLLRDASGIISLDSVRRSGSLFAPIPDEIYRLKQDKGLAYYWVRFTVENLNEASLNYLVCLQPGIDQVDQYVFYRDSLVQHSSVGTAQAAKTRHLFLSHELTMPITLHTGTTVVYLRLQSHSEYSKQRGNIILSISNENSFVNFFLKTRFYQGVALGMLILILVLHMFIYVFARERTYLIYMVNIFLTIIYLAFRKNFQLEFDILWPTYTVANYLIDPINFILELTAIWFAQEFLETKKTAPVYHKIMNGLKYAMGIGFVLSLFAVQLEFMNAFSLLIGFVASIVMLLAAIRSFQRGNNLAAYVFFGFVPLAIIIIIYVFPTANYLHYESNETDMHYFAEALRALIFSIGVAERFYQFKKAALRAGIEKEQLQFEQQRQIQQEKERISRDLHDNIDRIRLSLSLEPPVSPMTLGKIPSLPVLARTRIISSTNCATRSGQSKATRFQLSVSKARSLHSCCRIVRDYRTSISISKFQTPSGTFRSSPRRQSTFIELFKKQSRTAYGTVHAVKLTFNLNTSAPAANLCFL